MKVTTFKRTRTTKTGKKVTETVKRKSKGPLKPGPSTESYAKEDLENQREAHKSLKGIHELGDKKFSTRHDYVKVYNKTMVGRPKVKKGGPNPGRSLDKDDAHLARFKKTKKAGTPGYINFKGRTGSSNM